MEIIVGKQVLRKVSIATLCLLLNVFVGFAQGNTTNKDPFEISGKVTDLAGKPLVDVSVKAESKAEVVKTDNDGDYSISVEKGDVVTFTLLGFETKKVLVGSEKVINTLLAEVKIIPSAFNVLYSKQPKSTNVASVSEIYTEDVLKTISTPIYGTFTGRLAGLLTSQSSGEPGNDGFSLSLRGQTPLVLLDGVAQSFSSINPEQVESVTVLKDALATAMLGIRGANGAILITSKKGHVGPQRISFTALAGISQPTYLPKSLDAYNYSLLYNEALANDGKPAFYSSEALDAYRTGSDPVRYPNVNWQNEALKKQSAYSRYNLEMAGGGSTAKYYVSMDYLNQPGLFNTNGENVYNTNSAYKRYILRSNVSVDLSKNITTTLGLVGRLQDTNEPGATTSTLYGNIINTPANAYPIFNSDGSFGASQNYRSNVYAQTNSSGYRPGLTRDFRIDLAVKGKLDAITEGLWVKTSATINSYLVQSFNRSKSVPLFREDVDADGVVSYFPFNNPGDQSNSVSTDSQNRVFYVEAALGYNTSIDKHTIEAQLLFNNDFRHINRDLPYNIRGISGKGSYNYNEKYIAELAFAYNGTEERYPSGEGFGFFPAVGLGWNINKEAFLNNVSWLNNLKLRTTYGRVGNFEASYYGYNQYYNTTGGHNFGDNSSSASGIAQNTIANTNLTWEKADKFNVGIDANVLNNKLALTAEYFNNKYFDLLQNIGNNTAITGLNYAQQNVGISRYSGLEFDLSYQNKKGELNYFIAPNLTVLKTEVVYQDEVFREFDFQRRTGLPVGQRFGYIAEGLYQSQAEIDNSVTTSAFDVRPGDIKYRDLNNDGLIDADDQTSIGTTRPLVYYGVNLGLSWKGLDFSALLQGVQNRDIYLSGSSQWAFQGVQGQAFEQHLGRWTPATAASATYPRLTAGDNLNNDVASTYWMKSGNYMRLKSVELGYTLPISLVKKIKLAGTRIFINGTNLLTFSGLDDTDPENYNNSYPIQKMVNAGINVKF